MKYTNQNGRSILVKCDLEAQAFLSAVYKSNTQTKKRQADKLQCGRSMVEMLGVLAIIGVLSVGGIAGYSKAMNKFKINKTTDQVSVLVANLRTMFAAQGNFSGLTVKTAIDFGVVPDDMITTSTTTGGEGNETTTSTTLKNAFGGDVEIAVSPVKNGDTDSAFYVAYDGLSQEACVTLATGDWGSGQASGLIAMIAAPSLATAKAAAANAYANGNGVAGSATTAAVAQPGGSTLKTPMPVANAVASCTAAQNATPAVLWKYY